MSDFDWPDTQCNYHDDDVSKCGCVACEMCSNHTPPRGICVSCGSDVDPECGPRDSNPAAATPTTSPPMVLDRREVEELRAKLIELSGYFPKKRSIEDDLALVDMVLRSNKWRDDEAPALRAEIDAFGLLLSEQSEELRGAWSSINESRETEDALRAEVVRLNLEVARRVLSHLDAYQVDAARTLTPNAELSILALGLCGESGELVDHIKKHLGHGHDLDRDYVEKEIGDVLWYLAAIGTKLGISLQSAADKNIEKLRRRYPDGFSHEASRNRDDDEVGNDAPER